jgi:nickel transport protein
MRRLFGRAAFLMLVVAGPVRAHNLGAECKIRGDQLELEAYFDDDTPARNAKVMLKDASDHPVAEGTTDHEGRWSFPMPAAGKYEVIVDLGDGHRHRQWITVPARGAAAGASVAGDGPPREEFTRTPWLKIALGLALIALATGGVYACLRRARAARQSKPTAA